MAEVTRVERYVRESEVYLSNAQGLADKREFSKAAEMLWGALSQLVKALAEATGNPARDHQAVIRLAKKIAAESGDPRLREALVKNGSALHASFYEHFIDEADFPDYYQSTVFGCQELRRRLEKLLSGPSGSAS
jgi:hypothetical protein